MNHPKKILSISFVTDHQPAEVLQPSKQPLNFRPSTIPSQAPQVLSCVPSIAAVGSDSLRLKTAADFRRIFYRAVTVNKVTGMLALCPSYIHSDRRSMHFQLLFIVRAAGKMRLSLSAFVPGGISGSSLLSQHAVSWLVEVEQGFYGARLGGRITNAQVNPPEDTEQPQKKGAPFQRSACQAWAHASC
jgi:hypothetical protein